MCFVFPLAARNGFVSVSFGRTSSKCSQQTQEKRCEVTICARVDRQQSNCYLIINCCVISESNRIVRIALRQQQEPLLQEPTQRNQNRASESLQPTTATVHLSDGEDSTTLTTFHFHFISGLRIFD